MKVVKVNDCEVPVAQLLYDVIYHEGYMKGYADGSLSVRSELIEHSEAYAQGKADAIDELKNKFYERARDKGIYASEYIAFIYCTFELLKEQNE